MAADNRRKFKSKGIYVVDPGSITKEKINPLKPKKPMALKGTAAKNRPR